MLHASVCVSTCVYVYINDACTFVCVCVYINVDVRMYVWVCMFMHMCTFVYMLCVWVGQQSSDV